MPTEPNNAQDTLNDALWSALQSKNFADAELQLRAGAAIDHVNVRGETPFRFFAADGELDVAQWLLDRGANINAADHKGDTALIRSVERRDQEVFEWLLEREPDLNARSVHGSSALMQACTLKIGEMAPFVSRLLEEGADPSARSFNGGSPLLNAVGRNDPAVVELLVKAGADLNVVDKDGLGALHVAMRNDDENASLAIQLMALTNGALDVNLVANSGATPLSMASDAGKVTGMAALLQAGANPNVTSSLNNARTPLMVIVIKPEAQPLVVPILELGANPNARDAEGNNVLFYAAQRSVPGVIEALIKAGCNLDEVTGPSGMTPLHGVLRMEKDEDRLAALDALLDLNLPVDPVFGRGGKTDGNTVTAVPSPLSMAIMGRDVNAVRMLLDAGADANRLDPTGQTPMHHLAEAGPTLVERYAMQQIAKTKGVTQEQINQQAQVLNAMIIEDCRVMMADLVAAGGNINAPGKEGRTPLMTYVAAGREDLVASAFVTHHADPMQVDEYGDHAITEALKNGQPRLFQELVFEMESAGRKADLANVVLDAIYSSPEAPTLRLAFLATLRKCAVREDWLNGQDDQGNTPLIVAAATGQADAVDALIAMGANVNLANHAGETALIHGAINESTEMIFALRKAGANVYARTKDGRDVFTILQTAPMNLQRALRANIPDYEEDPQPVIDLPVPGSVFRAALATAVPAAQAAAPAPAVDEAAALAAVAAPAPAVPSPSSRPRMR